MTTHSIEFVERLLKLIDDYDDHGSLFWRCGERYGGVGEFARPASFFVDCSDTFWWGTSDVEEITPDNIELLEKSYRDAKEASGIAGYYASDLFAARVRGMRPQGAAYPLKPELWPLLDACGPEREVDIGNPKPHPNVSQ